MSSSRSSTSDMGFVEIIIFLRGGAETIPLDAPRIRDEDLKGNVPVRRTERSHYSSKPDSFRGLGVMPAPAALTIEIRDRSRIPLLMRWKGQRSRFLEELSGVHRQWEFGPKIIIHNVPHGLFGPCTRWHT